MAIRTSSELVKGVLAPGLDYDFRRKPSLTPFIAASTVVVDRLRDDAKDEGIKFTADELTQIETWLAAHLYKMSDQQHTSKSTLGASASYRPGGGLNLDGSTYGQTAKLLDRSGLLATYGQPEPTAYANWLGKAIPDQLDYEQRN